LEEDQNMREAYVRKSKLSFGFALILLVFILETFNANHLMPNKASPFIWGVLGVGALACAAYGVYCRFKARGHQPTSVP